MLISFLSIVYCTCPRRQFSVCLVTRHWLDIFLYKFYSIWNVTLWKFKTQTPQHFSHSYFSDLINFRYFYCHALQALPLGNILNICKHLQSIHTFHFCRAFHHEILKYFTITSDFSPISPCGIWESINIYFVEGQWRQEAQFSSLSFSFPLLDNYFILGWWAIWPRQVKNLLKFTWQVNGASRNHIESAWHPPSPGL